MSFIFESLYLSEVSNIKRVLDFTELSLDELETLVGRFSKNSWRAGQLRGEMILDKKGVAIRHHFTKKIIWRKDD